MATKLKNLRLTSVDLVRTGANQEADICLYKSADMPDDTSDNRIKKLFDKMKKAFLEPEKDEKPEPKEQSFDERRDEVEENPNRILGDYLMALEESFISIQTAEMSDEKKEKMLKQSLAEFNEAMDDLIPELAAASYPWDNNTEKSFRENDYEEIEEMEDRESKKKVKRR